MTYPEYVYRWAEEQNSDILKFYVKGYLVSKSRKNKIPTMLSWLTSSMTIIFTSVGVAVTPEINMADKKRK